LNSRNYSRYMVFFLILLLSACVTKKKKKETSKLGKLYHNTTAYYNGYWNAKEIMKESMVTLRLANNDNYSKILDVEDYVSVPNPKMVAAEMDKAIDKVSTVAALHEPSEWVDDCYVLMAKAQYLKQDYETTEETLLYFQEEFNPSNPYGRNYQKRPLSKEALKKKREEEKKEKSAEKEKLKKEQAAEKEKLAKEREQERKQKAKDKEGERKQKERDRKKEQAEKKKQAAKRTTRGRTAIKKDTPLQPVPAPEQDEKSVEAKPETAVSTPANPKKADVTPERETPPPIKPKTEKDKTAYTEGLIWLAKTQIKRQKWNTAEAIIRNIEFKDNLPEDLQAEMAATYADLYIKQGKYEAALPKLLIAAEETGDKQLKARYHYISAQIYQTTGDNAQALTHFERAKKYSRDFRMEFMAGLAIAKTAMITGKRSKESVMESLQKMTTEDKYQDVKYLIYFTMGEIEFNDNNTDVALEHFRQSNNYNSTDTRLKTEIYYSIANMYYNREKFLDSKLYFDSTLISMPQTDERYAIVKRYVDNLTDIATNMSIIQYQDTLLYIADLTGDEQKKAIYRLLETRSQNQDNNQSKQLPDSKSIIPRNNPNLVTSNFFAYNQSAKTRGKEEFIKTWGARPLSDNWRKSSRSSGIAANFDGGVTQQQTDTEDKKVSKEEYNAFLRELPNNPVKKKETNDKIMNAMFNLGKLFRDKIENYAKSASTLENMHTRYGFTPYELDSYYYLYLDYLDLNNAAKAEEYKNKITRKYPDSKYASILNDPDYFKKQNSEEENLETYYKATYAMFERGEYAAAAARIEKAGSLFGAQNKYVPKFALLGAMCMGSKEGKDAYIKALSDVITAYPNTPEQIKAREIMRFLGGDKDAFKTVQIEDVDKIYSKEDDKVHYVVVITYNLSEAENVNVKVSVSEYNKKNFKLERLQLGDASLNREDNSQIILIRKFENAQKAMEYHKKVMANQDEYISVKNINYDILPISQTNYRKMLSEGSAVGYRMFFEQNYLKLK
jgi:tetratricopeptide (TPR) repeat protein